MKKEEVGIIRYKFDYGNYLVAINVENGTLNMEVTPMFGDVEYNVGETVDIYEKENKLYFC